MRSGVIGLVFVRRRRISSVFALKEGGEDDGIIELSNMFQYDIHVSFVHWVKPVSQSTSILACVLLSYVLDLP